MYNNLNCAQIEYNYGQFKVYKYSYSHAKNIIDLKIFSIRIIVLDNGKIAEYDTPKKLLNKKDSLFYMLAKDAQLV